MEIKGLNDAMTDAENKDFGEESENAAEEDNAGMVEEEKNAEAVEAPGTEQAEDKKENAPSDGAGADNDVIPAEETPLEDTAAELPGPTAAGAGEKNIKPVKQAAKEKLEKERKAAKDSTFAEPIIEYLLKRCEEDEGMAEDVVQEHKTWKKCFDYIYSQARKQAQGSCAAVRDDVVYEWAEDYYHKDDKAEEEKKAKKAAEDKTKKTATEKAKKVKTATERKTVKAKGNTEKTEKGSVPPKAEALKAPPKPKKNLKEMDGQMDLFSMMGM